MHSFQKQAVKPEAAPKIVLETVYAATPAQVWRALTSRDALAHWLFPNDFQPASGQRFRFWPGSNPARQNRPNKGGRAGSIACKVVALEKEKRLAYTWQPEGEPETLVCWTLEAVADGTRVRLEHTGPQTVRMNALHTSLQRKPQVRHSLRRIASRPMGLLLLPTSGETVRCVSRVAISALRREEKQRCL